MAGLPTNSKAQQALQQWQRLFDTAAPRADEARQHWQQVMQLGIPHRKLEHWKYTPLERLLEHEFATAATESAVTPASATRWRCRSTAGDWCLSTVATAVC